MIDLFEFCNDTSSCSSSDMSCETKQSGDVSYSGFMCWVVYLRDKKLLSDVYEKTDEDEEEEEAEAVVAGVELQPSSDSDDQLVGQPVMLDDTQSDDVNAVPSGTRPRRFLF